MPPIRKKSNVNVEAVANPPAGGHFVQLAPGYYIAAGGYRIDNLKQGDVAEATSYIRGYYKIERNEADDADIITVWEWNNNELGEDTIEVTVPDGDPQPSATRGNLKVTRL